MPNEEIRRSFFDPDAVLAALDWDTNVQDAVDFGCGYGTIAVPAAKGIPGTLHGFDIEPEMIAECKRRADAAGVHNVRLSRSVACDIG